MACRLGFVLLILTALLGASPAKAQAGGEVSGIWLTQAGDAKVRVSKCGGGICGVIVWLERSDRCGHREARSRRQESQPGAGKTSDDRASAVQRHAAVGPNKWSGQIYNADDGQSYASSISVAGPRV